MVRRRTIRASAWLSTLAALPLTACAFDIGMFTRDPQDHCARPNVVTALVESLQKTPGMSAASLRDVSTAQLNGADTFGIQLGDPAPSFVCHATLVRADGTAETGRIVVSDGFRKMAWTSDEDFQSHLKAMAAQGRERQAQFERQKAEQKANQELLARCDPRVKARYDAVISQLSNLTVEYMQHSRANETAQGFAAQNDIVRTTMRLQAERLEACKSAQLAPRTRPLQNSR